MLAKGQIDLFSDLKSAYQKAKKTGETGDPIPDQSKDVGNAVHKYMETAKVKTAVNISPGQMYQAAAATAVPVASTTTPATAKGTGTISFEQNNIDQLIGAIEQAYLDAKDLGAQGGDVLEQLSTDMSNAIYNFAITAKVETDVDVDPGQVLAQYMMMAGTVPTPLPATTLNGTGAGTGVIS